MPEISPNALVEKGAQLADGVRVGPFSYVGTEVRIGPGCVIENNVTIVGRTVLGRNNHVFPMAVIGTSPEGSDQAGQCFIGDANTVREHVTIFAGAEQPTRIGTSNLIMIGCRIGAGAAIGDHGIFANCTHVDALARVEDYVRSSAFAMVYPGRTVGAYTFLAGYAGVDRDAPPFAMVQGFPFRVRGVNAENLRRCGFGDDDVRCLKQAFRELYNGSSGQADETVMRRMLADRDTNPHVRRLIEAIRRGPQPGSDQDE